MFKEYIAYLKDNPKGYWFKRKMFGWGWTPVKWQGWVVIALYVAIIIALAFTVESAQSGNEVGFMILLPVILLTITLIRICYWKGEKPKWQWGKSDR